VSARAGLDWLTDDVVAGQLEAVERSLLNGLADLPADIHDVSTHLIRGGGKRLRPALLLICARLGGGTPSEAIELACAVEWLHTATLYHDDIMDRADERRHRPSANARWGNRVAGFTANVLYARSAMEFARAGDAVNRSFSRAVMALCQGQNAELQSAYDVEVSEAQYIRTIEQKTATLCELPCEVGAMLAGLPSAALEGVRRFGRAVGTAFQLSDDLLDLFGSARELGKEPRSDLREGTYTLPVIRALADGGETADRLRDLLQSRLLTPAREEEIVQRLLGHPATTESVTAQRALIGQALAALDDLDDGPGRESLERFARLVGRRFPARLQPILNGLGDGP
jgi:heptaprenyl diphosphate synthase